MGGGEWRRGVGAFAELGRCAVLGQVFLNFISVNFELHALILSHPTDLDWKT